MSRRKQRSVFDQVSEFDRGRIVAYQDCGLSFREIGSRFGQNQATVMPICDRWMQADQKQSLLVVWSSYSLNAFLSVHDEESGVGQSVVQSFKDSMAGSLPPRTGLSNTRPADSFKKLLNISSFIAIFGPVCQMNISDFDVRVTFNRITTLSAGEMKLHSESAVKTACAHAPSSDASEYLALSILYTNRKFPSILAVLRIINMWSPLFLVLSFCVLCLHYCDRK
ncbi:transposable element Tcb1 transposase [Trichonephila clavipes]|nr:transposable element Tcb1 transposase [Trichonephila clavipes]